MPLDWTFTFLYVPEDRTHRPITKLILIFRDGKLQIVSTENINPEIIEQMEKMLNLIAYLAFFPGKDFTKILLNTPNNQHAEHYLDKRFLHDKRFLGVLSVSEYSTKSPFIFWGVEEMMGNYIFEYFLDVLKSHNISLKDFEYDEQFIEWISHQVEEFYKDWIDAREKFFLKEKEKQKINPLKQSYKKENTSIPRFEHWWDIQIINEAGLPVTHVFSFLNDQAFYYMDETENTSQNLISMSLSALKILIEEHGGDWNIRYLKAKLKNEMGYQYTFFKKFSVVKENNLLNFILVMNSGLFDTKNQIYEQILTGKEMDLLERIATKLKMHPELFSSEALLESFDADQKKVIGLINEAVQETFGD